LSLPSYTPPTLIHPPPSFPTRRSSDLNASDTFHYEPMFFGKHASRSSGWLDRQLLLPRDKAASNGANRTLECIGKRPGKRKSFRSEEHTSELQSRFDLVCRLLLEKKKI